MCLKLQYLFLFLFLSSSVFADELRERIEENSKTTQGFVDLLLDPEISDSPVLIRIASGIYRKNLYKAEPISNESLVNEASELLLRQSSKDTREMGAKLMELHRPYWTLDSILLMHSIYSKLTASTATVGLRALTTLNLREVDLLDQELQKAEINLEKKRQILALLKVGVSDTLYVLKLELPASLRVRMLCVLLMHSAKQEHMDLLYSDARLKNSRNPEFLELLLSLSKNEDCPASSVVVARLQAFYRKNGNWLATLEEKHSAIYSSLRGLVVSPNKETAPVSESVSVAKNENSVLDRLQSIINSDPAAEKKLGPLLKSKTVNHMATQINFYRVAGTQIGTTETAFLFTQMLEHKDSQIAKISLEVLSDLNIIDPGSVLPYEAVYQEWLVRKAHIHGKIKKIADKFFSNYVEQSCAKATADNQ